MAVPVDTRILSLAQKVIDEGKNKRAIAVLRVMLDKGKVSTDDIQEMGYNHPPRAIGDVRDAGIPVITGSGVSDKSGRRMAVYTFGDASNIQEGRIGGRSALPKKFKQALIARYGSVDCITRAVLDERVLQIDHRIPYRIAGDVGLSDHDVNAYMLLDASSQRAKSWSCENCLNMAPDRRDPAVCATCFWAYPDNYQHIATEALRRTEVAWQGSDVDVHDKLKRVAEKAGTTVAELLKAAARQKARDL